MRLVEGGFIERWRRELFPTSQCTNKEKFVDAQSITLEDMAGNFLLLLFGLGCALIFLCMEKIWSKYFRKKLTLLRGSRCCCACVKRAESQEDATARGTNVTTSGLQLKSMNDQLYIEELDKKLNELRHSQNKSHKDKSDENQNRNGAIQNGVIQNGVVQNGVIQNGVIQNGVVSNGDIVLSEDIDMVDSKYDGNFKLAKGPTHNSVANDNNYGKRETIKRTGSRRVTRKDRNLELL